MGDGSSWTDGPYNGKTRSHLSQQDPMYHQRGHGPLGTAREVCLAVARVAGAKEALGRHQRDTPENPTLHQAFLQKGTARQGCQLADCLSIFSYLGNRELFQNWKTISSTYMTLVVSCMLNSY